MFKFLYGKVVSAEEEVSKSFRVGFGAKMVMHEKRKSRFQKECKKKCENTYVAYDMYKWHNPCQKNTTTSTNAHNRNHICTDCTFILLT